MSDENKPETPPELPEKVKVTVKADKKAEKKAKKEKKKKKQGPIRFSAVIPLTVFIALVVGFNIYFLDSTIKSVIEYGGTEANGAEVNVGSVNSSFKELRITVSNIQFTNKKKPTHNIFTIGRVQFQLLWDAILRGKFVIDLAEIGDIKVDTKRSKPGRVPPPSKAKSQAKEKVLKAAQENFDGNVFGDIAAVAGGASTQDTGDAIKEGLESEKKFKELENNINTQKTKLEQSFKDLPSQSELQSLEKRLRDINWNDLGNLAKAPKVLKEADKLKKDIDRAIKKYQTAEKEFKKTERLLKDSFKEAEASVENDIAAVGQRMKIPTLNPEGIARSLFGEEIFGKVDMLKGYYAKVEKYLPPKKEGPSEKDKIKQAQAEKRRGGKDYKFGTPNSYPLFWMKLAKINSENKQGTVAGQIKDVTNDQVALGRLTTMNLEADFPPQQIRGVKAEMVVDHRDKPMATIKGRIDSFPVKDKAISKSKDVTFVLGEANVESILDAKLTPKRAEIKVDNKFSKIKYITKAESKVVDEVLRDVSKRTKYLTLDAKAEGKWDKLAFDIESNLARAIQNSVQGLVQAKIKEMKDKIRRDVQAEIDKQKAQVQAEINKLTGQYQGELNKVQREIDKVKGNLKQQEKDAKKKAKKQKNKAVKDLKKNLLKGLKL